MGKKKSTKRSTSRKAKRQSKKKGRVGSHPPHPPCPGPECGRALYKRMDPGPVKRTDAWAYCRNRSCPLFAKNQATKTRKAA